MMKIAAFAAAALSMSAPAFAQTPTLPPNPPHSGFDTVNRHFGFYIRPDLGIGYMTASESSGGTTVTISGVSGLGGVAIGGAVAENHILAVHLIDSVASSPNVSMTGAGSGTAQDSTLTLWGIGPEYTYYWMPMNVYFSGTLALTRIHVSTNGSGADSDWGVGTRLALGKEWWVSDHWGLGLAGHLSFSTNQDPSPSGSNTLTTWAFGAVFSATYN